MSKIITVSMETIHELPAAFGRAMQQYEDEFDREHWPTATIKLIGLTWCWGHNTFLNAEFSVEPKP